MIYSYLGLTETDVVFTREDGTFYKFALSELVQYGSSWIWVIDIEHFILGGI